MNIRIKMNNYSHMIRKNIFFKIKILYVYI